MPAFLHALVVVFWHIGVNSETVTGTNRRNSLQRRGGPIRTEMLEEYFTKMGPERTQAFLNSIPLRRAGEAQEIAAMVAFLATDASYVTGQVIFVNGGGPGG